MSTIHKSITIKAPVDRVYTYANDPAHLVEIWPSMVEVNNVKREESRRPTGRWRASLSPLRSR